MRRLLVAVRDLDPPGGGAERSLAALIGGVASSGPLLETAPAYTPLDPSPPAEGNPAWSVEAFASSDRGTPLGLLAPEVNVHRRPLRIEGAWSKVAWTLRERGGEGRPRRWAHARHLARRNAMFEREVHRWLDAVGTEGIGVTQLEWAAGAASAFASRGVPWVLFVRDETVFRFPHLYRSAVEGAAMVCAAGEGLLEQVRGAFDVQATCSVPLPVDFATRFGTRQRVDEQRAKGLASRDMSKPRIGIMVVTPEKGLATYHRLLPALAEAWPEAEVHVAGGSAFPQQLGRHPNATALGHVDAASFFSGLDVHVILFSSTGSWGRVISEAGLFGVPSVTNDIGSQREALGAGGVLVGREVGIDGLIAALRSAYDNKERLGALAQSHTAAVDHRRSIAAFRSGLEALHARFG